jgi:hypothetical protein
MYYTRENPFLIFVSWVGSSQNGQTNRFCIMWEVCGCMDLKICRMNQGLGFILLKFWSMSKNPQFSAGLLCEELLGLLLLKAD